MPSTRADGPSVAVKRFGTGEPAAPARPLRAGPLTATLDAGNLRHIRFRGLEVIRAISFVVRDRDWGTYDAVVENLTVSDERDGFTVGYDATVSDGTRSLRYRARIRGSAEGTLDFTADAVAASDFVTNRTGFVVLHPIAGTTGGAVTIETTDGRIATGRFPDIVDPAQPMMDLRALTHEPAPGLRVRCSMVGDTFEMEDQRNWTDASYKTYVRPLALPWPYVLAAGSRIAQGVHLAIEGSGDGIAATEAAVALTLGEAGGRMPSLGFGYDPEADSGVEAEGAALRMLGGRHLLCHHDPRRGHDAAMLAKAVGIARLLGATPWLEAVVTEVEGAEAEVEALGGMVRSMGSPFEAVFLAPAADLKGTLPGSAWPPAPEAGRLFGAARRAFPGARIGGGSFVFFTELNRKRPPAPLIDIVGFTTSALVHAGDDLSVMESLEALPAVLKSARAIAGGTPLAVGPSAIGLRMNPYGEAPVANPGEARLAMGRNDPRQRGLLGAAWAVGYMARMAEGGVETVTLGGLTGPFGLLHRPQAWRQPWFDGRGGLFPMFHALRGLAALAGLPMRTIRSSAPTAVQAIGAETPDGLTVWAANLTGATLTVGLPGPLRDCAVLDDDSFEAASRDAAAIDHLARPHGGRDLTLRPYAIARLRLA